MFVTSSPMSLGGLCLLLFSFSTAAQTAREVVKLADQKMRGNTSQADIIIRTVRPAWSREMKIKTWMSGKSYTLILIESPPRENGIVFLKRGKEVWNWLPSLERIIKLPPSMMNQSWMGTDFTNDDLVRESSVLDDYDHQFSGDTLIENRSCYKIIFMPKPATAVVWGKLVVCIDKQDFMELYSEFYDEEQTLIQYMKADEIKMMDNRLIPTRFVMVPVDKKNHQTEIIYQSLWFDKPIPADLFTVEKMKHLD